MLQTSTSLMLVKSACLIEIVTFTANLQSEILNFFDNTLAKVHFQ